MESQPLIERCNGLSSERSQCVSSHLLVHALNRICWFGIKHITRLHEFICFASLKMNFLLFLFRFRKHGIDRAGLLSSRRRIIVQMQIFKISKSYFLGLHRCVTPHSMNSFSGVSLVPSMMSFTRIFFIQRVIKQSQIHLVESNCIIHNIDSKKNKENCR